MVSTHTGSANTTTRPRRSAVPPTTLTMSTTPVAPTPPTPCCLLQNLGINLPYTQWAHELLVSSGEYYRDGTHLCYEFEVTKDLPIGIWCYHPHGMFSWFMGANHLRHSLPAT